MAFASRSSKFNDRGILEPISGTEGVKWYRKAAERGNVGAQYHLGYLYFSGRGVKMNYEEALKWYKLAAKQGNTFAKEFLDKEGIKY